MYKNFSLTEKEKKQILEQHKSYGNKKPMNEDEVNNSPKYKIDYGGNCDIQYTVKSFNFRVSILHEKTDNYKNIGDSYKNSGFSVMVTMNEDEPIIKVRYNSTTTYEIVPTDDSESPNKSSVESKSISDVPDKNIEEIAEYIKQEVSNSYLSILNGAPETISWRTLKDGIYFIRRYGDDV